MDRIEDIWAKGNEHSEQDESVGTDIILKSISERSIGITAKLPKTLWFGVVTAAMGGLMFIFNIFPYMRNLAILIPVIICLLLSIGIILFLLSQIRFIRGMDTLDLNLHDLLVFKIKYLNTRFKLVQHAVCTSIVLATFTINLSMESADGIFELRKILILSAFYLLAYAGSVALFNLTHIVYNKQLKNALLNLEENTLISLDSELRKHRRMGRVIMTILIILSLSGLLVFLLYT